MKKKNILLIGGCGFIGASLVRRFVQSEKYNVFIFEVPGVSTERIQDVSDQVNLIQGSLCDSSFFDYILEQNNIEVVVHLVSCLLPNSSLEDYQSEITNVIKPTIEIIHLCAQKKITFVYFSSGGTIYGDTGDVYHKETDQIAPISYYGLSKCNLENIIMIENRRNQLPFLILRPSNPYGHGQRLYAKQGLIAVAIGKILKKEPIQLFGDGRNVRDYIYIDDLAEYVYQLIYKRVVNEVFNIGSGHGYTNSEVIAFIDEISGRDNEIVNMETRSGDVKSIILNIDKLSRYVPIKAKSLKEGIQEFWNESCK